MGKRALTWVRRARAARSWLRERGLVTMAAAVLLELSAASSSRRDARPLLRAFALVLLLVFALAVATVDSLVTAFLAVLVDGARSGIERARPLAREAAAAVRPAVDRERPLGPPEPASTAAMAEEDLLDRKGRPLRGAARAARIAALSRERERQAELARPLPRLARLRREQARLRRWIRGVLGPALAWSSARATAARAGVERVLPRVRIPVPALSLRTLRVVTLATTMSFVFATAIGTTGFIAQRGTIALGASTTLTIISGEVEVRASESEDFQAASDGVVLAAGMTIHTGVASYAVLTYFEGSTVSLEPDTTLVIEALNADPDGSTVIEMRQIFGRTWHAVSKLVRERSKYEVRTPTMTATVRGTMFAVGVETDEQGEVVSTLETTEGRVATSKAPTPEEPRPKEEVVVQAGFQATVKQSAPLEAPKPAPEPERKVTVEIGAQAGGTQVVLDPKGRANGIKDGKVVVQTPGAVVQKVGEKVVVILPNVADGKLATVVGRKDPTTQSGPVEVVTTVAEKGKAEQKTEQRVEATADAPGVAAVEVRKSETAVEVMVEAKQVTAEEKRDLAASVRVAEPPKPVVKAIEIRSDDKDKRDEKREGSGGPGGPGGPAPAGFIPVVTVPPLPPAALPVVTDSPLGALIGKRATEPPKEQGKDRSKEPAREQPRAEPPKIEAPKTEAPKVEAPKTEAQKEPEKGKDQGKGEQPKPAAEVTTSGEASKFVPTIRLRPLPPVTETAVPKKEEPKKEEAPKIELPKIELPIFGPQQQDQDKKDKPASTPEPTAEPKATAQPATPEPKTPEPKRDEKTPQSERTPRPERTPQGAADDGSPVGLATPAPAPPPVVPALGSATSGKAEKSEASEKAEKSEGSGKAAKPDARPSPQRATISGRTSGR